MAYLWLDDRFHRFKYSLRKSVKGVRFHGSRKFFYKIESIATKEIAYTTEVTVASVTGAGITFIKNPKNYNPTLIYKGYIVERLRLEEGSYEPHPPKLSNEARIVILEKELKEAKETIEDLKQAHVKAANIMERILNILEK